MKQKKLCWARISKNIAYFIAPIFGIILIASIVCLSIMDSDIRLKDANNYYETKLFSDQYLNSIYRNYYNSLNYLESYLKVDDFSSVQPEEDDDENTIYYDIENNNFKYLIIDAQEKIIVTNVNHTMRTDTIEGIKQEIAKNAIYWNYENGKVQTSIQNLKLEDIRYTYQYENIILDQNNIQIYTALLDNIPYSDSYSISNVGYNFTIQISNMAPALIPISIIILILCVIVIIRGIGRTAKQEEIYLNWFDKWKLEIVIWIGLLIIGIGIACCITIETGIRTLIITGFTIGIIIMYLGAVLMLETIVKRIKTHTVWKSTIIYSILHGIKLLIDNRKTSTKLILYYWSFCLLGFILTTSMVNSNGTWISLLLLLTQGTLCFWYLFKKQKQFANIQNALKNIYEGNTNITLNKNEMEGVLKQLAIYVEDIAGGLSNAVSESLKSERLKTELITNVSHDIKTPLTSIINYVDLLKKEQMPNEKATEYLMILENKSQRLKKLTEDLVEASKASSGNIKLKMEKINVLELVKQISGEFEDKFHSRGLEEIINMPEEPIFIKADGRYMYRVLENIYSNAAKYAMENTRIYLDIIPNQTSVVIQMKNISQEKLNISADELMQRFVRGEESRNTEGSGLGLSIASSLTQLQGGKFHIYLDGDLFKITLGFEKYQGE